MKLTIACPCYNSKSDSVFSFSLHGTKWPCARPPILVSKARWVCKALREMVLASQKQNADFMIWISNDVGWEPDAILKLVKHDVPVVGGWANGRYWPFPLHVCDYYDNEKLKFHIIQNHSEHKGVEKVEAIGGEMICFRMDVFGKIPEPWFFGDGMIVKDENGVAQDMMTEDYYFFSGCRKYGVDVMVDWDVPLYHAVDGLYTFKGNLVTR